MHQFMAADLIVTLSFLPREYRNEVALSCQFKQHGAQSNARALAVHSIGCQDKVAALSARVSCAFRSRARCAPERPRGAVPPCITESSEQNVTSSVPPFSLITQAEGQQHGYHESATVSNDAPPGMFASRFARSNGSTFGRM